MLSLSTIKPAEGSTKKRKRVGRGNASGHGTYSTKGMKGQRSRSGVTGLKRLGMKATLLATPKKRGFTSMYGKNQVVNVFDINKNFKDNEIVSPATLMQKGLINDPQTGVKILGKGVLGVKVKFEGVKMSKSVVTSVKSKA